MDFVCVCDDTPSRWWLLSDITFTGATRSWQFCHCIWGLLQSSPPSSSSPSASYPFLRTLCPKPHSSPLSASYLLSSVPSPHTSWFLSASSWGPTGRSDCTPPEPDGTDETLHVQAATKWGLKGTFTKIITSTTSQYICVASCYGIIIPNRRAHWSWVIKCQRKLGCFDRHTLYLTSFISFVHTYVLSTYISGLQHVPNKWGQGRKGMERSKTLIPHVNRLEW